MRHIKMKLEDIWSWRRIGYPQYEAGWGKSAFRGIAGCSRQSEDGNTNFLPG